MATGSPGNAPPPHESRRWLTLYYVLAGLTALTLVTTLFMTVRVMKVYDDAVAIDHVWDVRRAEIDSLVALAFEVDQPVLRVVGETHPRFENRALDSAYRNFESAVTRIRSEYTTGTGGDELRGDIDSIDATMKRTISEASALITAWMSAHRNEVQADDRQLERDFAAANTMLARARADIGRVQEQDFNRHRADALRFHHLVQFLSAAALVMLIGLALYGRRLSTAAHRTSARLARDAEARAAAEAASRAKGDFLANMSHEIRTPMNGVLGMLELALETELSTLQRDYLRTAYGSAESLLSVINDVLDFSKIESGHFELDPSDFDLAESLADTVSTLAIRAQDKGLELTLEVDPEVPPTVHGDLGRLRQIIINLVGNAIKFTDRGEVSVRVSPDKGDMLHFSVRDTGVGIPADKQQVIFEAFRQADASTTRQFGGTGLGLAISSALVEMMHGKIWLESAPGRGSTFHFTASLPEAAHRLNTTEQAARLELGGVRVLLVDDNATNRRILETTVKRWHMTPTTAADGEEALALLTRARERNEPFDLVITDADMPRLDGFGLVERLRARPGGAEQTVLMLSSARHRQEVERCRALGVERYLTKPVRQSQLREAILVMLGRAAPARPRTLEPVRRPSGSIHALRILVAEDNAVNQKLARAILEGAGHQVISAGDGQVAADLARRERFDVILMDVQMPVLGGFEATRLIRERERATGEHVPIIAVTARAMAGDREECLAAGMDGYLSKPLRAATVLDAVEALMPAMAGAPAAVAAPASPPEVFDRSELDETIGPDVVDQLLDLFFRDAPGQLAKLRGAVGTDAKALREVAHTMKGAAGSITAARVAAAARAIELAAMEGRNDLGGLVGELDAAIQELRGVTGRDA